MDPYDVLAPIYSRFMGDTALTEAWSEAIRGLIRTYQGSTERLILCDAGCGNGRMLPMLSELAERIYAVDRSEAMLRQAEALGIEGCQVVRQDLGQLQLPERVHVITALLDTINHLHEPETLLRFFDAALRSLLPGGILIFDVLSEAYFREVLAEAIYYEVEEDHALLWANDYDEDEGTNEALLTYFVKEPDGRYLRREALVTERYYDPMDLAEMLGTIGFEGITVDPILLPEASGSRHVLVAHKRSEAQDD